MFLGPFFAGEASWLWTIISMLLICYHPEEPGHIWAPNWESFLTPANSQTTPRNCLWESYLPWAKTAWGSANNLNMQMILFHDIGRLPGTISFTSISWAKQLCIRPSNYVLEDLWDVNCRNCLKIAMQEWALNFWLSKWCLPTLL